MSPQLEVKGLSLKRAGRRILHAVSFGVPAGGLLMLIGPSGSGKSTLLRTLNRLLEPPSGTIFLDGVDITTLDVLVLRRRVGLVFQQPALFEGSVADNIGYGAALRGETLSAAAVAELLAAVALEPALAHQDAGQLSIGQAQRVALARTLANRPEILLLDEPTSALDPYATRQIETTLRRLNREWGLTLIFVSHAIEQTRRMGGQVLLLNAGRVLDYGPVADVLDAAGPHRDALAFATGQKIEETE